MSSESVVAVDAVVLPAKTAKAPVSDRTKSTLFIRNLPFTATNKDFEAFFSEYGPIKACFVVMEHKGKEQDGSVARSESTEEATAAVETAQKNKGFGFVHYALEDDALRALDALKTAKLLGRKLKGELAMRKHVKFDPAILAAELPQAQKRSEPKVAARPSQKLSARARASASVQLSFRFEEGVAPVEFSKKQLYKKVRKVGALTDLVYPAEGDSARAVATFASAQEASRALKKLDQHIFKGARMLASAMPGAASASPGEGAGVKAHRLIVRNLPFTVTPEALDTHFGAYGRVREIVLPTKPGSTALRGFAFVQFEDRQAAVLAMAATNGKELSGRMVAVDWAVGKTLYEQIVKCEVKAEAGVAEDDACGEAGEEEDEEDGAEYDVDENMHRATTASPPDDSLRTVFLRNIAFETNEGALQEKMSSRFGPTEYCKLVVNAQTGASRGTAFVRFVSAESATAAITAAARLSQDSVLAKGDAGAATASEALEALKMKRAGKAFKSVLVDNDAADSENGGILLDGRALSVVLAVARDEAAKLKLVETEEKTDKRRLGLLRESELKPATAAARRFWSAADIKEREAMVRSRLSDLRKNANSVVSDVRLSLRHLPTAVDEAQLRQVIEHLLREAVGHADEVLADQPVHRANAARTTPRLKQVKIVRASGEERESRAGRSKGFGFVELTQPAHALLAVRYANNYIPDVWCKQIPELFGRRLKHGSAAPSKKDAVVLAKGKPVVPVLEFAIDKAIVLEKTGRADAPRKQQVHRKPALRPTGKTVGAKRPGFNQAKASSKRQKK